MLCEWEPTADLLEFAGPKAWYCCEPSDSWNYQRDDWRAITSLLATDEVFNHWQAAPACRVPHVTHAGPIEVIRNPDRIARAVTIVSNAGPSHRESASAAMKLRTRFCTYKGVDLFGQRQNWETHKPHFWSAAQLPANYRGEVEGTHWASAKYDILSLYKVAICLENSQEFLYFTEKFVAAVQSGCIPVYQAHPSVRETFLMGASWVDPADYGFDPAKTLAAAMAQPLAEYWDANSAWLQQPIVKATSRAGVLNHIGSLLVDKAMSRVSGLPR